ncbi:hypothetical protein M405DRAFT_817692 [Rhizopogon salebrosus TDB-379]|nr:hypothetical protein M405DRAFT_817692 [Rhizopogon salebrosus TDB-379]
MKFSWNDHTCRKCAPFHSSLDVRIRLPVNSTRPSPPSSRAVQLKLSFVPMRLLANAW